MKLKILIASLLLSLNVAWAQKPDSLGNVNFNALEYLLQEGYKPARKVIDKHNKKERTQIGLWGGMSQLILGSPASPGSTDFGLSFTREWSPLHSFRFSTSYSKANRGYDNGLGNQNRYGIEFDDMFNMLDFFQGYKKERWTDLKTVVGVGAYYSDPSRGKGKFSIGVHAGLHLTRVIYKHLALFIEPRATLYTDGYDVSTGIQSSRQYHTGMQFLVGSTYYFNKFTLPELSTRNMYFEYYASAQGDYSDRVDQLFDKESGRMGPSFGLGIGKWYLPLGYRFSLFTGYHSVPKEAILEKTSNFFLGLRMEGMINFNKLFCHNATEPRLEVNGGAGYESNIVMHDREGVLKKPFLIAHGPTFSTQLLYRLNPTYGIFVQGRYSSLKYTETFKNETKDKRKKENIGIEFGLQYRRDRKEAFKYNKLFKPYNFIELLGGFNATVSCKKSTSLGAMLKTDLFGNQFGFRVGRKFSPYATIRASIETGSMDISATDKAHPFILSADYMLDFTSLFTRYRADRLFTFSPFIGVVYAHHERGTSKWDTRITTVDGNYIGLQLGLNEYFRINDRLGIFLEENIRVYKGSFNAGAPTYTKLDLNSVLGANAGVRYRF